MIKNKNKNFYNKVIRFINENEDDFIEFDDFDFDSLLAGDNEKAEEAGIDKETSAKIAKELEKARNSEPKEVNFDDLIVNLGGTDAKDYWYNRDIDTSKLDPYSDDGKGPNAMHTSSYHIKKTQAELSMLFPEVMEILSAYKPLYRARFEVIVSLQNKLTKALTVLPGDSYVRKMSNKDDKGSYNDAKDAATFKITPATLLGYEEIDQYIEELDALIIRLTDDVKDKHDNSFDKDLIQLWDKVHIKIKHIANTSAEDAYNALLDKFRDIGEDPGPHLKKQMQAFVAWQREEEEKGRAPYTGNEALKSAIDFAIGESRDNTLTDDEVSEILSDIEKSEEYDGDPKTKSYLLNKFLKAKIAAKYKLDGLREELPDTGKIRSDSLKSVEDSDDLYVNPEDESLVMKKGKGGEQDTVKEVIPTESDVEISLEVDDLINRSDKEMQEILRSAVEKLGSSEERAERAIIAVQRYKETATRLRKSKAMHNKVMNARTLASEDPVMVKYKEAINDVVKKGEFDFIEVLKQVEKSLKDRSYKGKKRGLVYREMTALSGGRLQATSGARHDTVHIIQLFNWMNVNPKGRAEVVSYLAKKYFDLFEILDLIDHEYIEPEEGDEAFKDEELLDELSDHFTSLKETLTGSTEDLETYFDLFDDRKFGDDFASRKLSASEKYEVADTFLHDSGFRHFASELLADYYGQLGKIITARLYTAMKHFFSQPKYAHLGAFKSYKIGGGDEYAIGAGRREFGEVANIIAYFAMNRTHTKEELKLVRNRFDLDADSIKKFKEKMTSTIIKTGRGDANSVSSKIFNDSILVREMIQDLLDLITDRNSEFGSARLDWLEFNSGLIDDFKIWIEDTSAWRKFNKMKMSGKKEDIASAIATLQTTREKTKKDLAKGKFKPKAPKKKVDVGPYNKIGEALKEINLQNYVELYERFVRAIVLNQVENAKKDAMRSSGKYPEYYEHTLDDDKEVIEEVAATVEAFFEYVTFHQGKIKEIISDDEQLVEI